MGRAGEEEFRLLGMLGTSALNFTDGKLLFLKEPELTGEQMYAVLAANMSNRKLAYTAVMTNMHNSLPTDASMSRRIMDYENSLKSGSHYNMLKAPNVLAQLLKATAGAVIQDSDDMGTDNMWKVFEPILELPY